MHKRGVSNLEFILAFVLFAGFTVAALYFFNPVKNLKDMDYSRDYTLSKIIENTSSELDSYSIVISESAPSKTKMEFLGIDSSKKVSAVNYDGGIMGSSRAGDDFCIDRGSSGKKLVTLYFSEDIVPSASLANCEIDGFCDDCESRTCIPDCIGAEPNPSYCGEVCGDGIDNNGDGVADENCAVDNLCNEATSAPDKYQISSSSTDKVISEQRIKWLEYISRTNYSLVKEQLNIPEDVDFSFSLKFPDSKITAERQLSNVTREIFTETNRVEVLRTSGIPQFGELTVSVW